MYKQYYAELYIYIYSMCRSSQTTEDILHDTFLKALISLKDSHTNIRAWLYTVSRNLCLNTLKKDSRIIHDKTNNTNNKRDDASGDKYNLPNMSARADTAKDTTIEEVLRSEQQRILYSAILELSPEKRDVMVMQYFAGLKQKEIAALMHLTPENVRVIAYRAKKDLKKILRGYKLN